jgi:hypothetical protein
MSMKVWPTETSKITGIIRAVVPKEKNSITDDIFLGISYPDILVCC